MRQRLQMNEIKMKILSQYRVDEQLQEKSQFLPSESMLHFFFVKKLFLKTCTSFDFVCL